ncbi:hypothetical protein [Streptomyces sp. NPDC048442]|uniref:hypothetical protein n=1 Tax=Streptomyces sp. NPDC048442 TaxID=3154823 RepID=UPI0034368A27
MTPPPAASGQRGDAERGPLQPTGHPAELIDPPDPALFVSRSVATGPYALSATIRLPMPMDRALRLIPSTVGSHRPESPESAERSDANGDGRLPSGEY